MDRATLVAELKTVGFQSGTAQLKGAEFAAKATDKAIGGLGGTSGKTASSLVNGLGKGLSKVTEFMSGNGKGAVSRFMGSLGGLAKQLGSVKAMLIAMIAVAVAKFFLDAARATNEFTKSLANIATLIPGNVQRVQQMGDSIQDMAIKSGKSMMDLTAGMYQVISTFPEIEDNADALNILDIAARAAAAGMATTKESIELLGAVSKGYGDTSEEMLTKVSDLAFTTVKLGVTTFPELAASIGKAVPLAKALGITVEELFAAEATLTGVTGSTAEVTTQLTSVMSDLLRPSKELQDLWKRMGVSDAQGFIEAAGGIGNAMMLIKEESEKTGIAVTSFIRQKEALVAFYALTGAQAETYTTRLEQMRDASGATAIALYEVTNGVNENGHVMERFAQSWAVLRTNMGSVITPILAIGAQALMPVMNLLSRFFGALGAAVALAATLIRLFATFNVQLIQLRVGLEIAGAALRVLTNIFRWMDQFIKAIVILIKEELTIAFAGLISIANKVIVPMKEFFDKFVNGEPALKSTTAALAVVYGAIAIVGTAFDYAKMQVKNLIDSFGTLVEVSKLMGPLLMNIFTGRWDKVGEDAKKIGDLVKNLAIKVGDNWSDMAASVTARWSELGKKITGTVKELQDLMDKAGQPQQTDSPFSNAYIDAIASMSTGLAKIERNAKVFESLGIAYDVAGEKAKLYASNLDKLTDSADASGDEVTSFIQAFGGMAQEQAKAGKKGTDAISAYNQAVKDMTEGTAIIERNAAVMAELGLEYDAAGARAELYKNTLGNLMGSTDATREEILKFTNDWKGLNDEIEVTPSLLEKIRQGFIDLFKTTPESAEALGKAFDGIHEKLSSLAQEQYLQFFKNMGKALADGAISGEEFMGALADMALALLDIMPQLLLQAGLQLIGTNLYLGLALIAAAGASALVGGLTESLASEKGNVFSGGGASHVSAYAKGGLIDSPIAWPMANGAVGIAGEAGTEAIVPLTRMSNGDLGVSTNGGGGGVNIDITIENHSGAPVRTETTDNGNGGKAIKFVIGSAVKSMTSEGEFDNVNRSAYGLKPVGVRQ